MVPRPLRCRPLVAAAALAFAIATPAEARVLDVTRRQVAFTHFTTIQAAVNAARASDWIIIDRGVYPESVTIRTSNLHLRGLDRNKVIVDGRHRTNVNGIKIFKASNVWVENLTVRNFDRKTKDGKNGNEVWWNGGDGSGTVGSHGWYGQYLTAYDTGLTGGYGLFVSNATGGFLKHVYASGFADSGLYIGACPDCNGMVDDALIERNALGYSGTNSGGHLIVQNSTFRNNAFGVSPNSLNNDDKPPPQNGACSSRSDAKPLPTFSSTSIRRCTIFRRNTIESNNNLTVPESGNTDAPWGVGVELAGTYADLIDHNIIRNNVNFGALVFENPNPFPATANTIFFQTSGNRLSNNTFTNNGTAPGGADIGLEGGVFGTKQSLNNCFAGNHFSTSNPANIEGTWGCQNATTPNAGPALFGKIVALLDQATHRHARPQAAPPDQPSMPKPCAGVPRTPLC
jgi:hypothetical protein